jgi:hypothetical protein
MKNWLIIVSALLLLAVSGSCSRQQDKSYSFFVAGHIYGKATDSSLHIHPPFVEQYDYIRAQPGMMFGVFTGDLVRKATRENFDTLVMELSRLKLPYHIAPGNHDMGDPELYREYFGDRGANSKTYFSFIHENDLFIILDGNLDNESITGEQLAFFEKELDQFGSSSRNIFVFVHQLIWWRENNEFGNIVTNYPPLAPDSNNFWTTVRPLLAITGKPVYLFAGDLGANHLANAYMYDRQGNMHYIATGMGQGENDNFIIVHVDGSGKVRLELVALQGERDRLGKLEDFILP